MVKLGNEVEDIATGVTGILISRCEHLDGHVECSIRRTDSSGNIINDCVPEVYLKEISEGVYVKPIKNEMGFKCIN